MSLDGYCDHNGMMADEELHQFFSDMLLEAGVLLYGRITYQLMEYWKTVLEHPTGNKEMDEFAKMIDKVPKIVFSRSLKSTDWHSAVLAEDSLEEEVLKLKNSPGKNIFVGSPGLIASLTDKGLIDEYRICIHPVIMGKGLQLFRDLHKKTILKLIKTKTLKSGVMVVYYKNNTL